MNDLEERLDRLGSELYSVTREMESDGRTETYIFHQHRRPPPILAVVIGDFIHNAWSALNHMAGALHIAHSGIPTDEEWKNIEYPLALTPTMFKTVADKRIWGVDPQARAIIERNQPHQRPPLRWLYRLAIIDRHRKLNLLYQQVSIISWMGEPEGRWLDLDSYVPLEDGAAVGRFRWDTEPDPNMKFKFSCEVAVSDGRIERARWMVNWIYLTVIEVRGGTRPVLDLVPACQAVARLAILSTEKG